jgi:hypothetical protein
MFQNIQGQAQTSEEYEETNFKEKKLNNFFKVAITPQKILVYIVCLMVSTIECVGRNSTICNCNFCSFSFKWNSCFNCLYTNIIGNIYRLRW